MEIVGIDAVDFSDFIIGMKLVHADLASISALGLALGLMSLEPEDCQGSHVW